MMSIYLKTWPGNRELFCNTIVVRQIPLKAYGTRIGCRNSGTSLLPGWPPLARELFHQIALTL
jgi:hypothetical protein